VLLVYLCTYQCFASFLSIPTNVPIYRLYSRVLRSIQQPDIVTANNYIVSKTHFNYSYFGDGVYTGLASVYGNLVALVAAIFLLRLHLVAFWLPL
jgi:hypothetical protein